jgi:hypothetical protein
VEAPRPQRRRGAGGRGAAPAAWPCSFLLLQLAAATGELGLAPTLSLFLRRLREGSVSVRASVFCGPREGEQGGRRQQQKVESGGEAECAVQLPPSRKRKTERKETIQPPVHHQKTRKQAKKAAGNVEIETQLNVNYFSFFARKRELVRADYNHDDDPCRLAGLGARASLLHPGFHMESKLSPSGCTIQYSLPCQKRIFTFDRISKQWYREKQPPPLFPTRSRRSPSSFPSGDLTGG